jgi:hypothetical protein
MVEKSYTLRDRLKSLLITYVMREIEQDRIQSIEQEINLWMREVLQHTTIVLCSATAFEVDVQPLEAVKVWTEDIMNQLLEHVRGTTKMELPNGRLKVLMVEFRMAWEKVWIGYLRDEKTSEKQYSKAVAESLQVDSFVGDCDGLGIQWDG